MCSWDFGLLKVVYVVCGSQDHVLLRAKTAGEGVVADGYFLEKSSG